jgi:ribosomal-protein-alanine N-acetyltransferase
VPASGRRGIRVQLTRPSAGDRDEYLKLIRDSRSLHKPWVYPPKSAEDFALYLHRARSHDREDFFLRHRETSDLLGVFELSVIVRGPLRSTFLGFYASAPHAGKGYMREGLALVLDEAFETLKLHRVEASIQPGNERSRGLVGHFGFRCEGYSPKYLKIGGRWRDHERWAILSEEWKNHALRRRKR